VVVIDDEAETRAAIESLLRGWGAEVAAGASVAEALEASTGWVPDVALLDYALGAETGLDALDELERRFGTMPAAVLTGEDDPAVSARVRARGLPLLRKPAPPVQIRAVLSSLVRR